MNTNEQKEINWQALTIKAQTLFSPSAPIDKFSLFAGRLEQIDRLINAIFERGKHAVLFGEQGVGKTSLTNILHEAIDRALKGHFIFRKQCSPQDTYSSLWHSIFKDITFQTQQEMGYGKTEMQTHTVSERYEGKNLVPDDVLRELSRVCCHKPIIIILDEFDKFIDIEAKKMMSHTMKAISDMGINATLILVGVAEDINLLVESHASITRNIDEIKMPRMSHEELNEILDKIFKELEVEIEQNARKKIIDLAKGLPEYIHALGKNAAITAFSDRRKKIIENDVKVGIKKFLEQSTQSLNESYKKAIHSNKKNAIYKEVLIACAMADTDGKGFSPSDLIKPLSKILNRKKVNISAFQTHLSSFCSEKRGDILKKEGVSRAFKYRFREPKMQPYVIMQNISISDKNKEQKI